MDLVRGLFALARANEIHIGIAVESDWFLFIFGDRILHELMVFEDTERSAMTYPAFPVQHRDEWRYDEMTVALAQMALECYRCHRVVLFQSLGLVEQ